MAEWEIVRSIEIPPARTLEQFRATERLLREARAALAQVERESTPFEPAVVAWDVVRGQLATFDLVPAYQALRGLIDRAPGVQPRNLHEEMWDLRRDLFCWGPGRAKTREQFAKSEHCESLSADIKKVDDFLRNWSEFFTYLGFDIGAAQSVQPEGPPIDLDGIADTERRSTPRWRVLVPDAFLPGRCVYVDGQKQSVSKQGYTLLKLLSNAREANREVRAGDLEGEVTSALTVLRRLREKRSKHQGKVRTVFFDVVEFPGAKSKGGYRLL